MKRSIMKTILLLLFSFLMISFAGCQKENVNTGLVGKWEWVSTSGGIAGIHQTPQTLGYTYTIAFTKEGQYELYDKNNLLVSSSPYTIVNAVSIFDNKEHSMIQSDNLMRSSFEIRKDSLFLSQEVVDGFDQIFIRK